MIPQMTCEVGEEVRLSGYAIDYGKAIAAVEFSLDGMEHWTRYETAGADGLRRVNWEFSYVPTVPGNYTLYIRSVNEDGDASPTPDTVELFVR